ncbi:hypothetical protein [Rheinheimera sp. F8]|uniref:hypothetical protein n=1 Tax=Rheinheimera sp. F8 TaxID=1763998 RepID=UPI000744C596|nr:hypothetical protein [Rheinheimera sp. F8]ALZ76744.1 hypothetical protein ATY27_13880 [Rheinheimera sp. F8]
MTNPIQVWIPTTQGVSRVLGLVAEDADVQSVVCINHSTEALAVSSAYHQFVRKGTGIIHRHVGHGAFRLDVDHRVDQGSSWQLPVFMAHLLLQQGRLWQGNSNTANLAAQVWIATGTVNVQGEVGGVSGIADKLLHLYEALRLLPAQPFQLFFSRHNQADVAAALLALDEPVRHFFSQYQPVWLENVSEVSQLTAPPREQKVTSSPAPLDVNKIAKQKIQPHSAEENSQMDAVQPEETQYNPSEQSTQAATNSLRLVADDRLPTSAVIAKPSAADHAEPQASTTLRSKSKPWFKLAGVALVLGAVSIGYWAMQSPSATVMPQPGPQMNAGADAAQSFTSQNQTQAQTPPMLRWSSCSNAKIVSAVATRQGRAETASLCQLQIEVAVNQQLVVIKMPESAIVKSGGGVLSFAKDNLPGDLTSSSHQLLLVQFSRAQPSEAVVVAIEQARTFDFISAADLTRQLQQEGIQAQVYLQVWQAAF